MPAKHLFRVTESFLWATVPGTYAQRACNHLCSYAWLYGSNQRRHKGFWVPVNALGQSQPPLCATCPSWEGHKFPMPSSTLSSPCHLPTSAASIWAVLCKPNGTTQGVYSLALGMADAELCGKGPGGLLHVLQLTEPAESVSG